MSEHLGETTIRTHRPLAVHGAWTTSPVTYHDHRGTFVSPYVEPEHVEIAGRPLFPPRQVSFSRSRLGVARGIHFTRAPSGCEKYVYCSNGSVLDYVVDLRIGSPTFGQWDSVQLDAELAQAVYLPVGVGHAFVALTEGACMTYLLSAFYVADNELAISLTDPAIGLRFPTIDEGGLGLVLSTRDTCAPTLDECRKQGLLPHFEPEQPRFQSWRTS